MIIFTLSPIPPYAAAILNSVGGPVTSEGYGSAFTVENTMNMIVIVGMYYMIIIMILIRLGTFLKAQF